MQSPIYLDYNATTPLDRRVFEAMKPFFLEDHGNAGSRSHWHGQRAKEAVEQARAQVAAVLGAEEDEIIFTSGATESNNLAILGLSQYAEKTGRKHVIATAIEHKAILEPLDELRRQRFEIDIVPVTQAGFVEPQAIRARLRSDTLLVSVMHANNETGVVQPIEEISALVSESNALFHTDAAQSFGKEVESLRAASCDLASISGHKIYGPKGVGALVVRRSVRHNRALSPLQRGGGQERGLRPGTIPVPLIAGLGKAAQLAQDEYVVRREQARAVKEQVLHGLGEIPHQINGDPDLAQPHVLNVSFSGVDSEALMLAVRDKLSVSNGSACTSASYEPSHVLRAMGLDDDRIECAIRLSWGPGIEHVPLDPLKEAALSLRAL